MIADLQIILYYTFIRIEFINIIFAIVIGIII